MLPHDIRFLLPTGRSLQESTLRHLKTGGITVAHAHQKCYIAEMWEEEGRPGWSEKLPRRVFFAKPTRIVEMVASGEFDAGITGFDAVQEIFEPASTIDDGWWTFQDIEIRGQYHYGRTTNEAQKIVLFSLYDGTDPLEQRPGPSDSVATEYPNITERIFKQRKIEAKIIPSVGCVETRVHSGDCAYGITLMESGQTLKANHFVSVSDLMTTYPVLIVNINALDGYKESSLETMVERIDQALRFSMEQQK